MMPNDLPEATANNQKQKTTKAKEKAVVSNKYFDSIPDVIWIREIAKHLGLKALLSLRLTSTKFYTIFTEKFLTLNLVTILNGKQEISADSSLLQKYKSTLHGAFYRFISGENSSVYLKRRINGLQKEFGEVAIETGKQLSLFSIIKNALNITDKKGVEGLYSLLLDLEFSNLNRNSIKGNGGQEKYETAVELRNEVQSKLDELLLLYINDKSGNAASLFEDKNNKELIYLACKYSCNFDIQNSKGITALMRSVKNGNTGIARMLLDADADIDIQDEDGNTALIQAVCNGYADVVKLLLDAGADANIQDEDGNTALMLAAYSGHAEIVKLLLDAGADANIQDEDRETALMWAAAKDYIKSVKLLLDAGADVNIKNRYGVTALMCAARGGYAESVKLLLEADADADVNIQDEGGETALNYTEYHDYNDIKSLIKEYKKNTTHPSFINSCHIRRIDFLLNKQLYEQAISYINGISSLEDLHYMHKWIAPENPTSNTPNDGMTKVIDALKLKVSNLVLESSNKELGFYPRETNGSESGSNSATNYSNNKFSPSKK